MDSTPGTFDSQFYIEVFSILATETSVIDQCHRGFRPCLPGHPSQEAQTILARHYPLYEVNFAFSRTGLSRAIRGKSKPLRACSQLTTGRCVKQDGLRVAIVHQSVDLMVAQRVNTLTCRYPGEPSKLGEKFYAAMSKLATTGNTRSKLTDCSGGFLVLGVN